MYLIEAGLFQRKIFLSVWPAVRLIKFGFKRRDIFLVWLQVVVFDTISRWRCEGYVSLVHSLIQKIHSIRARLRSLHARPLPLSSPRNLPSFHVFIQRVMVWLIASDGGRV